MSVSGFKDSTKLTQWLRFFLYVGIIFQLIIIYFNYQDYCLLLDIKRYSTVVPFLTELKDSDETNRTLAIFTLIINIATIILFLRWIYYANSNVRVLGAKGLNFSPGWAVGYYFIPVLNLWKPYQAMKEIWQASRNPSSWNTVGRDPILPWWWFFFLVSCFLGRAIFRASYSSQTVQGMLNTAILSMAFPFVSIPTAILALILVKSVYEMQMAHLKSMSSSKTTF